MPTDGTHTIPAALEAAAQRFGSRPAYVEGGITTTYADLLARVREAARRYVALGVEPGDRIALWAPNSVDWVVAGLGISYAGGTLVPINSRYTGHEAADLVSRSAARVVVVDDGFLGRTQAADLEAAGVSARIVTLHESDTHLALCSVDATHVAVDVVIDRADAVTPDDVADILFTSGTTGRPKGAMTAHRQTVGVARVWGELGGVTESDRYLVVNPFFHSFGYKVGIVTALLTGATLYPVAAFDVDAVMTLIEDERITVLPGAPTIYQSLLTAPGRDKHDLSSLRLAVTGAAVVPVVLIERMRASPDEGGLGIDTVVTAFGMTEAVVVSMARDGDPAELVASTCGRAIPGMEVMLGTGDELLVRGEFVMLGYLDDPAATAEAIDADGWLHTGDIATLDADGNLRITDRLKDMYICGGFNVYPAEVEQVLMRMPGVSDVAVVGVPDERMGEVGKAYVVGSASPDDLVAYAKEHLANFKVPRFVELVEALPRNPSGKVLKTELRQA
ncbi:FadD3 family acyl-CoA ligase [Nocardioides sp. Kera G14]|nr:FadD3 family acyl-CoA ligase [Nocardioides sp. Kera G14]